MSHNFFIVASVVLIVLSIVFQVMIGVIIQNMINETDNMTATDNKLLKQCKLKFMNCYRMNGGVSNVQIFTEKFINRLKIGKISLVALQHLSGQLVLLSVFVAGVGIYFGITHGEKVINLLPYYIISFLGLYLYFSVSSAVDIPGKRKILKTNLVDYLENHMISHLNAVPESIRELEEKENGGVSRKGAAAEHGEPDFYSRNPRNAAEGAEELDNWFTRNKDGIGENGGLAANRKIGTVQSDGLTAGIKGEDEYLAENRRNRISQNGVLSVQEKGGLAGHGILPAKARGGKREDDVLSVSGGNVIAIGSRESARERARSTGLERTAAREGIGQVSGMGDMAETMDMENLAEATDMEGLEGFANSGDAASIARAQQAEAMAKNAQSQETWSRRLRDSFTDEEIEALLSEFLT